MFVLFIEALKIFIILLEALLLINIFLSMFPIAFLKKPIGFLLEPILLPIQKLLKHSVFHSPVSDMSPIMAFIVLSYIQQIIN